jgi:hypothetical protein
MVKIDILKRGWNIIKAVLEVGVYWIGRDYASSSSEPYKSHRRGWL